MAARFNHELLVRARTELGLTQDDCARIAGVDVRTYRRYESGEVNDGRSFFVRTSSRRRLVNRLCAELGIAEEDLVREEVESASRETTKIGPNPSGTGDPHVTVNPARSMGVFVSYSGESEGHRAGVEALACLLRAWGAQVAIDTKEPEPPGGWAQWSMAQFADADVILMICTPVYRRRIEQREVPAPGRGGTWEGPLLSDLVYDGTNAFGRIGTVLLDDTTLEAVPSSFRAAPCYRVPGDNEALRAWLAQPARRKRLLDRVTGSDFHAAEDELRLYANAEERDLAAYLRDLEALRELDPSEESSRTRLQLDEQINAVRRKLRSGSQLNPGQTLDAATYTLIRRLGTGGFGSVWLASDVKVKRSVAIKVLKVEHQDDRTRRVRFFRGARVMASLSHPNIVKVFDAGRVEAGHHYFVMEYVKGGDLQTWVKTHRPELHRTLQVVHGIGDALFAAHQRGVFHRDVKPANILVGADEIPKLTDFDLVYAPDTTGGTQPEPMGTYLYSSPEVLADPSEVDGRADVYSLAMTLLFCVTHGALQVTSKHDVSHVVETTSAPTLLKQLIIRATAWDPTSRPQTMKDFLDKLAAIEKTLQSPLRTAKELPPPYPLLRSLGEEGRLSAMVGARWIVGRSLRSDLVLNSPFVSGVHAEILWTGETWMIRDCGSRNGTLVDQSRIMSGEQVRLREGAIVAFGDKLAAWELVAAQGPPEFAAVNAETREIALPTDGILTVSSGDHEAAIYLGATEWIYEGEDGTRPVTDGDLVEVGADRWTLRINGRIEGATTAASGAELSVGDLDLVLHMSRDEEFVQVVAKTLERTIDLGARGHHYLLFKLARRRTEDAQAGIAESECGWISMDECAKEMGGTARVNIDVFRIRRQFLSVGVKDGATVIARRASDKAMRIGTGRLTIVLQPG
jgi:serine/threonine protein kinase